MALTASEMVAKMETVYEKIRTTILAGNMITRQKRNEIIHECEDIIMAEKNNNSKFLGYTPELGQQFENLKIKIVRALPALKYMEIVN